MTIPLRVLVVDDALLIREGVRRVLDAPAFEVVAAVGDLDDMRSARESAKEVDAIVLDIRMPPTHTDEGLRALEALRRAGDPTGVLLLSMYASKALAERAVAAGAGTGYLLKDRIAEGAVLRDAVRKVASGGTVIDPEVVDLLVERSPDPSLSKLTKQERRVLGLMTEGRSNAGIAQVLSLSPKTVETHVANLLGKLRIETTPEDHRRVLAVLRALGANRDP